MRKPITAARRESTRKKALVLPLVSGALGVAVSLGSSLSDSPSPIWIYGGLLVFGLALLRFHLVRSFLRKDRFYGATKPDLGASERELWHERVVDPEVRFGHPGGLTLTNRRLYYAATREKPEPPPVPRQWPIESIRSVSTEGVAPVMYAGDLGGTLVFDVGEDKPQRFRVFDPVASAALINTALDQHRANTQKGPTT